MQNMLFLFLTVALVSFSACQKEVIVPNSIVGDYPTVSNRSINNTTIEVAVVSFSLESSTMRVVFSSAVDLTEITPEDVQTLSFRSGSATFNFQVSDYTIVDENLEITFELAGFDPNQYTLDGVQFIIIVEGELS